MCNKCIKKCGKNDSENILQLTFNAGKTVPENGKHYFVVYYIKSTDETKNPRACWADHKDDPDGTKRLFRLLLQKTQLMGEFLC